MTNVINEYESEISDNETINTDSDISSDESIHSSDEEFIDDSDISSEDDSENEYIPPYKRFINESKEKVEIKFENGGWVLKVINV